MRLNETVIIMSSHYNEDLADLNSEIFYFDGKLPINRLFKNNKFKDDV